MYPRTTQLMKRSLLLLLTAVLAASAMICPSCGATNPDDAEDCWNCGTLLTDMYPCPCCGHLNSAEALFCSGCLADLPENPSVLPEQPVEPVEPVAYVSDIYSQDIIQFPVVDYHLLVGIRAGATLESDTELFTGGMDIGFDVCKEDYLTFLLQLQTLEASHHYKNYLVGIDTYRLSIPPLMMHLGVFVGYSEKSNYIEKVSDEDEQQFSYENYFTSALCFGTGILSQADSVSSLVFDVNVMAQGLFRRGEGKVNISIEFRTALLF